VGGVPVQPRHALPQGREALPAGRHPDRLLDPLLRTESGFQPISYDEALDFTARRISEIADKYGPDAVAIYGGASMITEKAYVLGKFARVALGTKHIDYNGRLCMVSAGTAYKLAFGIDRATNPWTDLAGAGGADRRLEHRRVRAHHDALSLAVPREGGG
jgi:assimilatory nitrate reductase catalytic subunit